MHSFDVFFTVINCVIVWQLIFRKVADVQREKELSEKRKNDPPLELPSDHPLRKLISRFRKKSDPNVLCPSPAGQDIELGETGGGSSAGRRESSAEIRARKKSVTSGLGGGLEGGECLNEDNERNLVKQTILDETIIPKPRFKPSSVVGSKLPVLPPKRASKWGAVFSKSAQNTTTETPPVTTVATSEATVKPDPLPLPPTEDPVVQPTCDVVKSIKAVTTDTAAAVPKRNPLMDMLKKSGALKPSVAPSPATRPDVLVLVPSVDVTPGKDSSPTPRDMVVKDDSSLQQRVISTLADLRVEIKSVNERLQCVETRLDEIVQLFSQLNAVQSPAADQRNKVCEARSCRNYLLSPTSFHVHASSGGSETPIEDSTNSLNMTSSSIVDAHVIRRIAVTSLNPVDDDGTDCSLDDVITPASIDDVLTPVTPKDSRSFAGTLWKQRQRSTTSFDSDRSTVPLLKRSSTPELHFRSQSLALYDHHPAPVNHSFNRLHHPTPPLSHDNPLAADPFAFAQEEEFETCFTVSNVPTTTMSSGLLISQPVTLATATEPVSIATVTSDTNYDPAPLTICPVISLGANISSRTITLPSAVNASICQGLSTLETISPLASSQTSRVSVGIASGAEDTSTQNANTSPRSWRVVV